ncbi:class I SAM-dependent methyltransferase [Nitrosococcus watsonii]|uniref:Methyltransferase type 12 n=1 Tax=Nitrosococcus watsoni (strain C-113) TaxID=105559 RepID=D8K5K2_NITWC|nr:class I SAM-dependent methyltransferase [Nitrosococcus watsonii]ADJ28179.1 Methyltransferase type 12 [Nitrosococcus watsonii C-113]
MENRDPTEQQLRAEADALCRDHRFRRAVWECFPGSGHESMGMALNTAIHPHDQMLIHSLRHHRDPNAAVSQYYNVALQQYFAAQQILQAFFPNPEPDFAFLDFACGFGRLVRLLTLSLSTTNVWVAEIQKDALAFVTQTFNVQALESSASPEQFQAERQFDFIWVASLFSHLPPGLFQRWLQRLLSLLNPRGILCFSVHDQVLLPVGASLPETEILFNPHSENAELNPKIYGTTFVSESFVRHAIHEVGGEDHPYFRIPKGLAQEQDLYVVAKSSVVDLPGLQAFRYGPWGWVDERRISESGELYLRGWAASLDDGALPAVEIKVNGTLHQCPTGLQRKDVRQVFGDDRLEFAGWEFSYPLASQAREAWVEVTARTVANERALLYVGSLSRSS